MKPKPIIIDCDAGADDVLAILLALKSPEVRVLGITAVCGNSTVQNTAYNATRACLLAGRADVPVYRGAAQPLKRTLEFSPLYGGEDGLCNSPLPGNRGMILPLPAADFLVQALREAEEPVTIVSTGAMTNLALALNQAPDIAKNIAEVATASGYYCLNQAAARAEWNILVDPEAAEAVFDSGVPVRAAGLDVTALLQDDYLQPLMDAPSGTTRDFLAHTTAYNSAQKLYPCSVLVDPMAVAVALAPTLASYVRGTAKVHPQTPDHRLMSFDTEHGAKNVLAAKQFDFERFIQLLKDRVFTP